ncbi:uncharacterized protein LOC143039104 [Oratosquilla oratoria]|uniref:uncharacterized protein LOC143039104 n=1 Tax=Oratosquilla oratoria TaxID=337810 RepID=UPI003F76BE3C
MQLLSVHSSVRIAKSFSPSALCGSYLEGSAHDIHVGYKGGIVISFFHRIVLLCVSVAVAWAAPQPDSPPVYGYNPPPRPTYNQPGMPFEFAYAVKDDYSGNDYAHEQKSDGKVTSGSYHVALPDGRIETVNFDADDYSGYVAEVSYEGVATHPAPAPYHPAPAPYYPTPAPYHPTPAPYHPTPAPYHPTPAPYHPTPAPYHPPPTPAPLYV